MTSTGAAHTATHRVSAAAMDDDGVLSQESRRKKKKRDSGVASWTTESTSVDPRASGAADGALATHGTHHSAQRKYPSRPSMLTPDTRRRAADSSNGEPSEDVYEYPINILLMLTNSALFHSSPNHMQHLLSAIHFLLCGPQASATGAGNTLRRKTPPPSVPSGTQTHDNPQAPLLSSLPPAEHPVDPATPFAPTTSEPSHETTAAIPPPSGTNVEMSDTPAVEFRMEDERPSAVPDTGGHDSNPDRRQSEAGHPFPTSTAQSSQLLLQHSSQPRRHVASLPVEDRVLQAVSPEAASVICRLITGVPPVDGKAPYYNPTFLSLSYTSPTHQSPLPVLSRIIARLYWSPKHHASVRSVLVSSITALVQFIASCLTALRAHTAEIVALHRQQQNDGKTDVSLDFLPPEHLRTPFDASLNLLLRLVISLQDVFWNHPSSNISETAVSGENERRSTTRTRAEDVSSRVNDANTASQGARSSRDRGEHNAGEQLSYQQDSINTRSDVPPSVTISVPTTGAAPVATEYSGNSGRSADRTTMRNREPFGERTLPSHEDEDVASLAALRDLFDAVGMPMLWTIADELLRDIEAACPFLSRKTTQLANLESDADSPLNSPASVPSDFDDTQQEETAARQHRATISATTSAADAVRTGDIDRATDGAPAPSSPILSASSPNTSRLNPPLVVNQLLPLINCYLVVQQVGTAADLGFRASCVPRVVSQQMGTKVDAQLQQRFSEQLAHLLLNPDGKSTKRHTEMLAFCERHRRVLNLLIQHSPGILSGAFQPLIALTPMCISFENKRQYFRQRLKQLRDGTRYEPIRLNVRRSLVFMDSFHQLRMRNGEEMKGKLVVHFQGEEGVDVGGLTREWFGILAREMFNPDYALFRREGTKSEFNHPNPLSHVNPDHLCFFKFVGRIIGKAIYDGQHLGAYFTRSFYKHMLGRKVSPSDAECIDPEFYKGLQMLLSHNINDLGLDLRFSTDIDEFGRTQIVDLIPDGRTITVTEENKHEYVKLVCEHKISRGIRPQIESFLEGFHELIPSKFLTIFDDKELELLISGISFVDVNDLRANTTYQGYESTSPQIYWFWDILEEMDQNCLATFLQFVTGTSRVPLGGFRELMGMCGPQRFSIHKDFDETRLPSAHTCFNQLDLPEYSSKELLKEKLFQAISEGSEGFGFA